MKRCQNASLELRESRKRNSNPNMYNDSFEVYPRKINGFIFAIGSFMSAAVLLVWSFFSNKWGESLVLPTNDSTLDIGTKIYYGLNELCILNFGENSVAEAQCSPLTNDMSRLIDGTLERDIRIGKAIIASSIGMSVLLVIVLIYGSIECLPHRLSNLKRHLLFVAMAALDFTLVFVTMVLFTVSRRQNHQDAIGGGDSFGIGFIIGWISLLFKFNGLLILTLLLHFKA